MEAFSTNGLISLAWQKLQKNLGTIIGAFVIVIVVEILFQTIAKAFKDSPLQFVFTLIGIIINLFLQVGLVRFILNVVDDTNPQISDLFTQRNNVLRFFLASILSGVVTAVPGVIIGFIIAGYIMVNFGFSHQVIPSNWTTILPILLIIMLVYLIFVIYVSIRFQFYSYYVIDKNVLPLQSIKASWNITKGKIGTLLGFGIKLFLLNLLGVFCLFVGLVVTIPLTGIALALAYRRLSPLHATSISNTTDK